MKSPQIHPAFTLQGKSFSGPEDLCAFVRKHYPEHAAFLCRWFDASPTIDLQTSGSTGSPKTITFPKEALIKSARRTVDFFNLYEETTALLALSPRFVAGKMMWIRALQHGWHLDITEPSSRLNPEKNYDFSAWVPMQAENSLETIDKIKTLIIGGAAVSRKLQRKLLNAPTDIFLTYGMTETLTHIAVMPLSRRAENYKDCMPDWFTVLPGVFVETDEEQCLVIYSDDLPFSPLHTNDIVKCRDNRHFQWIGRKDNVINSGGVKLFPEMIEKKLAPLLDIPFIVTSLPDAYLGEKVVLVLEGKPQKLEENLFEKAGLHAYEKPKAVFFMEAFPRTSSGKIQRRKIKDTLKS